MFYIDEYLIISFFIDYVLLYICSKMIKVNINNKRILLSAVFSQISIISIFVRFNYLESILFKIIISSLIVFIAFGFNDIKTFIKNIIYYHIVNFFLGGILFYLKNSGLIKYKYYILLIPIIMGFYKYFILELNKYYSLKYKVTIYLKNGKILYLNGYMDTGNNLIDPYNNKKVIIINKKIDEKYYLVPYQTIDSYSFIKCFTPKKVYIDGLGERNDISVGIVNKRFIGYNCLLNYKLLEGKC